MTEKRQKDREIWAAERLRQKQRRTGSNENAEDKTVYTIWAVL